jgi:hypothetical protein
MDQGLRHNSSDETTVRSSEERSKFEAEASEQGLYAGPGLALGASPHSPPPSTRFSRLAGSSRARSPRLYNVVDRAVKYIRGPRPKVDLPSVFLCFGSLATGTHNMQTLCPSSVARTTSKAIDLRLHSSLRLFDLLVHLLVHGFSFYS